MQGVYLQLPSFSSQQTPDHRSPVKEKEQQKHPPSSKHLALPSVPHQVGIRKSVTPSKAAKSVTPAKQAGRLRLVVPRKDIERQVR